MTEFKLQVLDINTLTEKDLDKVKETLDYLSNIYYNEGIETGYTDEEFDKLVKFYQQYKEYKVGAKPTVSKKVVNTEHIAPELVGTTVKINNSEELEDWVLSHTVNRDAIQVAASIKYDGNSVLAVFDGDGKLEQAITRGGEGEGADITPYFSGLEIEVPKEYKGKRLAIKSEAMVTYADLDKLIEESGKKFANPRGAVTGLLSGIDNVKYSHYLKLTPLVVKVIDEEPLDRLTQQLELIEYIETHSKGGRLLPFTVYLTSGTPSEVSNDLKELYQLYIDEKREKLEFDIDGLVIEFLDNDLRESLGRQDTFNKYEVALKFPYLTKKTTVEGMTFMIGNSGRITPVVQFKEVVFNGAVCKNVSIANYQRFSELNLSKGDEVIIQYRNDTLSYLIPSPTNNNAPDPIPFTDNCPSCGGRVSINDAKTFAFCTNASCKANVVGKITNWFTKLNLKGIKESTIGKLVDADVANTIADMYDLDQQTIVNNVDGLLEKSANNIVNTINSKKTLFDHELFGSLGIAGIGRRLNKEIFQLHTMSELTLTLDGYDRNTAYSLLSETPGFSETNITKFLDFFETNKMDIFKIISKLDEVNDSKVDGEVVELKKVVLSGFRDKAYTDQLPSKGYEMMSSVSKKTDILVVKDKTKKSSKITKAESLGITIMNIDEFKELVG